MSADFFDDPRPFRSMTPQTIVEWEAWANSFDFGAGLEAHYDSTIGRLVTYAGEIVPHSRAPVATEARHETPAQLKAWVDFMRSARQRSR